MKRDKEYWTYRRVLKTLEEYWEYMGYSIIPVNPCELVSPIYQPEVFFSILDGKPTSIAYKQTLLKPHNGEEDFYNPTSFNVFMSPSNEKLRALDSLTLFGFSCDFVPLFELKGDKYTEVLNGKEWKDSFFDSKGHIGGVSVNGLSVMEYIMVDRLYNFKCQVGNILITYNLENLCLVLQGVKEVSNIVFRLDQKDKPVLYKDVIFKDQSEFSRLNPNDRHDFIQDVEYFFEGRLKTFVWDVNAKFEEHCMINPKLIALYAYYQSFPRLLYLLRVLETSKCTTLDLEHKKTKLSELVSRCIDHYVKG